MKAWLRYLGPLVVIVLAVILLRDRMPFLAEGYQEVLKANTVGLVLALVAVLLSMVAMAEVMRQLLRAGGTRVTLRQTTKLTFIANSWSSSFPGGAALSTVYQFHTMRGWGVSVLVSSWFIVLSGAIATLWLVMLGAIGVVFLGASFSLGPLLAGAIGMSLAATLLYALTNNPHWLTPIARKVPKWSDKVESVVHQLSAVRLTPARFVHASLLSLSNWLLDVVSLWFCIWAVTDTLPGLERMGEVPSVIGVTLAFVTAKIVGTAQITPAGVGPVEAAMTASLVAVGMTATSAFAAVFVYRILSFAVVTIIGWVVYAIDVARGGQRVKP